MNFSEINAFLHVLDHCLINMDVVSLHLSGILSVLQRLSDSHSYQTEVTRAPWAHHEKCVLLFIFSPNILLHCILKCYLNVRMRR